MLQDLFLVSLTVSAVILLILPLRSLLRRRYPVARLYLVWLILAVRLVIPFRWQWENAPVQLPMPPVSEAVSSHLPTAAAPAAPQANVHILSRELSAIYLIFAPAAPSARAASFADSAVLVFAVR